MKNKIIIIALLMVVVSLSLFVQKSGQRGEIAGKAEKKQSSYDSYRYGMTENDRTVDFGTQPNAIFTSECLFHDRILKEQLDRKGWTLREHRYRNGSDMLPYADGRLDMMILGDIPAFIAMSRGNVGIYALCRQGYNTVIAGKSITPAELKGMRVGYSFGTTAHFALDKTLEAAGLNLDDVVSVPMAPDEMVDAMKNHAVDAVVSWEPTATKVLSLPGCEPLAVSEGFSYFSFDQGFTRRHPDLLEYILAAVVRAVKWTKIDEANIRKSLVWDRKGAELFFGKSPVVPDQKWISLMRKETLDNPSFPMIPLRFGDKDGIWHQQFEFLKEHGILPQETEWAILLKQVNTSLLPDIINENGRLEIDRYNYSEDKLFGEGEAKP
jgi:hypothetical protein